MRILVTGVGGMCGKAISSRLKEAGMDVVGTYRNSQRDLDIKQVKCDLSKAISTEIGHVDCIVHCAGALPYRDNKYLDYVRDNIDTMRNIIAYAKMVGANKIIYLSTIGVYGEFRSELIDESADIINPNPYGLTKLIAERLLQESGIKNISLRMPGIIGREARGIWFTDIYQKFCQNETVRIYNPDYKTGNFVDVDDLAGFVLLLCQMADYDYSVVNLSCKELIAVGELVKRMKQTTRSDSDIVVTENTRKSFRLDSSRAYSMGYNSRSPLDILIHYYNEQES